MIPTFPNFKNIEWKDRTEVEQFTKDFPPYSDFNFVSMWSWNTREKMRLSQLNGNLVLLFYDYITETPFLSFIGTHSIADTAQRLIDYSLQKFQVPYLKLIPEFVAVNLPKETFCCRADEDAHDYILSVEYLSSFDTLPNSHHAARMYKKYSRQFPNCTVKKCSVSEAKKEDYIQLFKDWAKLKCLNHLELNEYSAFERYIQIKDCVNTLVSLYDGDTMTGFAAYEIISSSQALGHFIKANNSYKGVYDALNFTVSKLLKEQNIDYWNFEQDLGVPALRESKRKLNPAYYLKKFIVESKTNSL